jgi:membrane-associated phospholipid phosphatase
VFPGKPTGIMNASLRTAPGVDATLDRSGRHTAARDGEGVPALAPRNHGLERALATPLPRRRPIVGFVAVALLGLVVLDAIAVAFGLLLVHVLLPFHGLGGQDERVNAWLAAQRDSALNTVSFFGSSIGDVPVLPVLVTIAVVAFAVLRRWRVVAFLLGGIVLEVVTYRVASLIVHRHRPDVVRLDHLPVNQSYPSGHVAASVVVYLSLALVVTAYLRSRWLVRAVWALAIVLPMVVATSRMYRGMHHPIDVASGALIGIASLTIALLATRVSGEKVQDSA